MLGMTIQDEWGMERSENMAQKEIRGMELLPVKTAFGREKTRTKVKGSIKKTTGRLSGLEGSFVSGYETHMGESEGKVNWLTLEKESGGKGEAFLDGCCKGNVYGTYVHGFFDSGEVIGRLEEIFLREKGMTQDGARKWDRQAYKEQQYDKLAEMMRKHLDMEAIYGILEGK